MEESRKRKTLRSTDECPYLDTIERSLLDFDFEPACSVSLEKGPHIYACLTCGVYLRGRGPSTPAYTHSVEQSHFCFIHLDKGTFHCLPDDYEIIDSSLDDVRAALHPTFAKQEIERLDSNSALARDLFGRRYLPGFCGLNNLHKTDCLNAICQALSHVQPLRDFFLSKKHGAVLVKKVQASNTKAHAVAQCFGDLVRKIWSNQKFKSSIDPHPLVQALASASSKFHVGTQMEVGELMNIILHNLHIGTGGGRKTGSIIQDIFQGQLRVTTRQAKQRRVEHTGQTDDRVGSDYEHEDHLGMEGNGKDEKTSEIEEIESDSRFMQLSLDIPEKPLFRDSDGGLVIPQEPLQNVLRKFDGITFSDAVSRSGAAQRKRYQLTKLPNFLIMHLQRFRSNKYTQTKNPTIVMFPVKKLDLGAYVQTCSTKDTRPTEKDIREMGIKDLKGLLCKHGMQDLANSAVEKAELVSAAIDFTTKSLPDIISFKYDLVANIIHDSPPEVGREGKHDPLQDGSYKCHVQQASTHQWYEIQDLDLQAVMPQQIGLSECYLLIFRRNNSH